MHISALSLRPRAFSVVLRPSICSFFGFPACHALLNEGCRTDGGVSRVIALSRHILLSESVLLTLHSNGQYGLVLRPPPPRLSSPRTSILPHALLRFPVASPSRITLSVRCLSWHHSSRVLSLSPPWPRSDDLPISLASRSLCPFVCRFASNRILLSSSYV